jgi:hypothetical protein
LSTDFKPTPPLEYARLLAGLAAAGLVRAAADEIAHRACISLDGKNYLHCYDIRGLVAFTRFGHNDVEPILRAIDAHFGVRVGPEHEREDDDAVDWNVTVVPPPAKVVWSGTAIPHERLTKLERLFAVVKSALEQKGDDVCWKDIYNPEVAAIVGVEFDPQLLPSEQFLRNCAHYHDCLKLGLPYVTPEGSVTDNRESGDGQLGCVVDGDLSIDLDAVRRANFD